MQYSIVMNSDGTAKVIYGTGLFDWTIVDGSTSVEEVSDIINGILEDKKVDGPE